MGNLILVCTVSIISVIAFTYLPVTGAMGATSNTTAKVNATPNTTPQSSDFGYYFQKRATAPPPPPSYLTNTHTQKPVLTCDQAGHPSCYSIGYSKGFLNTRVSCSATTLNSFVLANPSQVNNFCSGYRVAQQQALQQQR
jgi:hypothetical protein